MGKSKRNRKKNKAAQAPPPRLAAEQPLPAENPAAKMPLSKTAKFLMALIILAFLSLVIWLVRGNNGEVHTTTTVSQPAGSGIQTGGSQPLAPSGSVDLQPSGRTSQAGGVQTGQSL